MSLDPAVCPSIALSKMKKLIRHSIVVRESVSEDLVERVVRDVIESAPSPHVSQESLLMLMLDPQSPSR